jgi:hypothetical protein
MLCAVALVATACGSGSGSTIGTTTGTATATLVHTVAGSEYAFPNIQRWIPGKDETSGTDNDPPGFARVAFDGQASDLRGVLVLVKPEGGWTPEMVGLATDYMTAAAKLGAGRQGAAWVSREVGLVAGGQKSVQGTTTFGSVLLTFVSEDIANQPGMTMDVSFKGA